MKLLIRAKRTLFAAAAAAFIHNNKSQCIFQPGQPWQLYTSLCVCACVSNLINSAKKSLRENPTRAKSRASKEKQTKLAVLSAAPAGRVVVRGM